MHSIAYVGCCKCIAHSGRLCYSPAMAKTYTLNVRIEPDLIAALKAEATAQDRSMASAIAAAIRAWLASKGDKP